MVVPAGGPPRGRAHGQNVCCWTVEVAAANVCLLVGAEQGGGLHTSLQIQLWPPVTDTLHACLSGSRAACAPVAADHSCNVTAAALPTRQH